MLEEADNSSVGHGIEEAPDIRVKHPIHLLPQNAGMEGVQRIVLATSWPESVGEPEEVFLVDYFENRRDRLLDDFVLQARHSPIELHCSPVSLWDRLKSPIPFIRFAVIALLS